MTDLTNSPHVGVRWQAQMEEHLDTVRKLTSEALLPGVVVPNHGALAQAHATAALALAVANAGGDIEMQASRVADAMGTLVALTPEVVR